MIQGLTEFLPISSSAHLILLSEVIKEEDQGLVFDVGVHFGTLLAAVIYFRKEIKEIFFKLFSQDLLNQENRLFFNLCVALIPVLILGYFSRDYVETNLRTVEVIAFATIGFGVLLYLSYKLSSNKKDLYSLTIFQALIIGLCQCLSLIPGTSRSGITITAGLFLGLNATSATRFSFLLAIPTIAMITLAEIAHFNLSDFSHNGFQLLIAAGISFAIAYLTISIFLGFIERIGFTPFVIYRLLLGGWLLVFWL